MDDGYGRVRHRPNVAVQGDDHSINALTMISQRVERDEPVSLQWLLDKTREQLAVDEKKFR